MGNAFWNFRRQGGVKTWKPSVLGYGYFLELPNGVCQSFLCSERGDNYL